MNDNLTGTVTLAATLTAWVIGVAAFVAGCTVLPSSTNKSQILWKSYDDARGAYDRVAPDRTTDAELRAYGFSTDKVPNIRLLNYVDVVNLFGSGFRPEDLPAGVQTCVAARDSCFAYVVKAQDIRSKRVGNVMADLFGFRRQTHVTGWEFQATLVLVNNVVVYKMWNGTPKIENEEKQSTPLGPMQNLGGIIPRPGGN